MNVIEKSLSLLGCPMRDRVTGFAGMVSSVSFDAYGCVQCVLTPEKKKDGTLGDGHWFDVKRLEPDGKKKRLMVPNFDKAFGEENGPAEKPPTERC